MSAAVQTQPNDPPQFDELLQGLIDIRNKDVDEYNELSKRLEDTLSTLNVTETLAEERLKDNLALKETLDKAILKIKEHRNQLTEYSAKNTSLEADAKQKLTIAYDTIEKQKTELKDLKALRKENKRLKEQNKRQQQAAKGAQAQIERLKRRKADDNTDLGDLYTCYQTPKEVVLVYPKPLLMGYDGTKTEQMVLLYTDLSGNYITACINEKGDILYSINYALPGNINPRTKATVMKYAIRPSERAEEIMKQWLIKVNHIQGMKLKPEDMTTIREGFTD